MIEHPLQISENIKVKLIVAEVQLTRELIIKNFFKYIKIQRFEHLDDPKIIEDLVDDKHKKIKKLNTLHKIIFKKYFISKLDIKCIEKFNLT